ncbi:MAG: hypothetical protein VYC10_02805, partial [Pseudomonadota bacterium]|nr:hypothetical protein [Pseudomonadota bacterium]
LAVSDPGKRADSVTECRISWGVRCLLFIQFNFQYGVCHTMLSAKVCTVCGHYLCRPGLADEMFES